MLDVHELDTIPEAQAAELLRACCGASRWVSAMVARRPFGTRDAVLLAADLVWRSLGPADWHEAFRHHPRIGARASALEQPGPGAEWSENEQAGVRRADDGVRRRLAAVNREYEQRFGYIYIVNATGKSAEAMLQLARRRLANRPEVELHIAAAEQEQIMLNRIEKLLDHGRDARSVQ